jgi:hypothetical protein
MQHRRKRITMLKLTTCLLGIISSTLYSASLLAQTALPLKVEDAFRNSPVPSAAMSAVVIPLNSALRRRYYNKMPMPVSVRHRR